MYKFAFSGVQGSGKTTLLLKTEKELKSRGIHCVLVNEVARKCPFPVGIDTTFVAQLWIFNEQLRQECCAMGSDADVVLCDRTLLDNVIYLRRFVDNEMSLRPFVDETHAIHSSTMRAMHRMAVSWFTTYDMVVRLPLNIGWLIGRDEGDVEKTIRFAEEINHLFDYLVSDYVTEAPSSVPVAAYIADKIEEEL